MNFKHGLLLIGLFSLTSACVPTGPTATSIGNDEAFSYIDSYMAEYEQLKKSNTDNNRTIKWIQPDNKVEPCKVYVGTSKDNDRTLDESYKLHWDGECKNGYAYGLGREFEKSNFTDLEAIAIYSGKEIEPDYYIETHHLENATREGNITDGLFIVRRITDDPLNFDITYSYEANDEDSKVRFVILTSPFESNVVNIKAYPNFGYKFFDISKNEFEKQRNVFITVDKSGTQHGFGFDTLKNGRVIARETVKGKAKQYVQLPVSYFDMANEIVGEIKDAGQKAINARQQALKVKKQYTNKICKDSVTVDFMDMDEYKAICDETEFYADLKEKINAKLAEIEKQNQTKREQLYQQERVNAQRRTASAAEVQARAAQRQADAAEQPATYNYNNNNQQLLNSLISAPQVPIYSGSSGGGNSMQLCNQNGILVQCR